MAVQANEEVLQSSRATICSSKTQFCTRWRHPRLSLYFTKRQKSPATHSSPRIKRNSITRKSKYIHAYTHQSQTLIYSLRHSDTLQPLLVVISFNFAGNVRSTRSSRVCCLRQRSWPLYVGWTEQRMKLLNFHTFLCCGRHRSWSPTSSRL